MKRNRIDVKVLVIMMVGFLLFGCATVAAKGTREQDQGRQVSDMQATQRETPVGSKEIADELGRTVLVPENPQRVLALTSAAMQALYNIGISPVGKVEEFKVSKEGVALPSVGSTANINIESVYALRPDFIIASSRFHAALDESLGQTGAPVYYFDPDRVGEIPVVEVTTYIGALLGKEAIAEQYVQSVFALAEELQDSIMQGTGIKTGIMIQDGDTITAAQSASSYGSMLALLGIGNIVPDSLPGAKKASFVPFGVETILERDPDILFIIASSNDFASNKALLEKFENDAQWKNSTAVRNGRVIILPFSANPNRSTAEDMLRITADAIAKKLD
ncbi:MAG: hypothetical protein CVV46_02755 [Spirochaetae bacterium HGW-Spirochaetae-2]|jgi:iron complex transport system substrate-binding protein|nr:MAG: hypothetical protein CVV46_02755 [Spirochaetae bacterium HGW-Spirochaetae-2]